MARTTLTKTAAPGSYSHLGAIMTLTAGDASNNNQFNMAGGELIVVRNSGVVTRQIVLVSSNDAQGRTRDITETLTAGQVAIYGPFHISGWRQADGMFYLNPEHADLLIGVVSFLR